MTTGDRESIHAQIARKRGDWKRETWLRQTIIIVGTDIVRLDNAAPYRKGGHRETWQVGTILQGRTARERRDWTTRHQIKQIATGWTSVGPRKNWTCWTISELNPVCHDSTAALIVACSFCVQSAILSALIRGPYSRGSTTEVTATAARTKTRTGMSLAVPCSANFRGVGIGNGSRSNNLGRLLRSVHRGATWGFALVPCGHRTRRQYTRRRNDDKEKF